MGSGAAKQSQGSTSFRGTYSQAQFPRPQSRPPNTSQSTRPSRSSASTVSSLSLQELDDSIMVCELCSANFTIFKRKYKCLDCSKLFCSNCIRKEPRRCCKTCCMFVGSKDRSQLMQIKVKDLRQYLAARDISTMACREKEELVDLVVQYLAAHSNNPFMVTVNNLEDTSESPSFPRGSSQPVTSQADPVRTNPVNLQPEVIDNSRQEGSEPRVNIYGETDLGVTRNAWPEGSSTSDSEAEHSPVESFSNTTVPSNTTDTTEQPQQAPARKRASISDLSTIEDVEELTVRQLKEILTLNFINYKGCVERWELEERVRRLYNEREGFKGKEQATAARSAHAQANPASADMPEDNTCKICMDSPIDCVLLECGHMVTCTKCGKQLAECPMCRQYIIRAVHVFRS